MNLYDKRIKELAAKAGHFPPPGEGCVSCTLDNYLCGDRVTVAVEREQGGRPGSIGIETRGCLLTLAAAALICERGQGAGEGALRRAIGDVRALVAEGRAPPAAAWRDLEVFSPVHVHKHRHECVLLPFEALEACLDGLAGPVAEAVPAAAEKTGVNPLVWIIGGAVVLGVLYFLI